MSFSVWFPIVKELLSKYGKNIVEFLSVLIRDKIANLVLIIFLFILAIFLYRKYWQLTTKYQDIFNKTLALESEETPQKFKGIESFILSFLDDSASSELKRTKINSQDFIDAFDSIQSQCCRFKYNGKTSAFSMLKKSKTITDNAQKGFLFLPKFLIRGNFSEYDDGIIGNSDSVIEADKIISNKLDSSLLKDIEFTKSMSNSLQELTNAKLSENESRWIAIKPYQVYVITKNGINRIFSQTYIDPKSCQEHYGFEFREKTFFPSRPYFWPTFENNQFFDDGKLTNEWLKLGDSVSNRFHITKPYIDLAGNGFVITLTRGIKKGNLPQSVICLDFKISYISDLIYKIKDEIGDYIEIDSVVYGENHNLNSNSRSDLCTEFKTFDNINGDYNQPCDSRGNIQVFKKTENQLCISIPLGIISDATKEYKIILLKIDFGLMKNHLSLYLVSLGLIIILTILYIVILYYNIIKRSEEYSFVSKKFDFLLKNNTIPYCRLSANDKIDFANPAFFNLLKFDINNPADSFFLKNSTLKSLCSDALSIKEYENVEQRRKKNEPVEPYSIRLNCKDESVIKVTIVSGSFPVAIKGKSPVTFGLIFDPENSEIENFRHAVRDFEY